MKKKILCGLTRLAIVTVSAFLSFGVSSCNSCETKVKGQEKFEPAVAKLNVEHISFYDLIIENNTKLKYDLDNNKISLPDEDESIKMRDLIDKYMPRFGYHQYEISNWAKDSFESLHNKPEYLFHYLIKN